MSGREAPTQEEASSSSAGAGTDLISQVQARLAALGARAPSSNTSKQERKERYAFWETQPVVQFEGGGSGELVRHVALSRRAPAAPPRREHAHPAQTSCGMLLCARATSMRVAGSIFDTAWG